MSFASTLPLGRPTARAKRKQRTEPNRRRTFSAHANPIQTEGEHKQHRVPQASRGNQEGHSAPEKKAGCTQTGTTRRCRGSVAPPRRVHLGTDSQLKQPDQDHQSSAKVLARVRRVVFSGDMQAIVITPTHKDVRAAQALLQLAAQVERDHTLQGRRAPSLIRSTDVSKSSNHSAISREQEGGGNN